jgi:cytochrome c551/c552
MTAEALTDEDSERAVERSTGGARLMSELRQTQARADRAEYLSGKILGGAAGVWGAIPMPAQNIPKADAQALAAWIAAGAAK